jgi:undecaprenol kinase
MKGLSFAKRLGHAWDGLTAAWQGEQSLRIHALATAAVTGLLLLCRSPAIWWAVMALTIALVVALELMNTALEALADHLHPGLHPAIKHTKDVAAGAVLLASGLALVVALAFGVDQLWPWLHPLLQP